MAPVQGKQVTQVGQFTDLTVLAETQRHLDALWKNDARANRLLVPGGSRKIFDAPAKRTSLATLSIEIDELLSGVYMETLDGRREPGRTLSGKRDLIKATVV